MPSLAAVLAAGLRSTGVKASVSEWLGKEIRLTDHNFWRAASGTSSFTGEAVSVNKALQLATVWACVRLISETIGTLPLGFYERKPDGSRAPANRHTLYTLLHDQPNQWMTAAVFWEIVAAALLLRGNAYIEIVRNAGYIVALEWLNPDRVSLRETAAGAIEYRYLGGGTSTTERVIRADNVMHIPAFTLEGRIGLSPIKYGANVLGTSVETDRASAETFQNSLRSPGIATMDRVMKPDERESLRKHIETVTREGGVMVLEKGAGFEKLTFDPVDAQLLESRGYNVEEMCRWFRVDPAMIGHGSKDSNWGTGLEQKMLWFLTFTLRQWCVRIEQAVRKSLLTPVERQKYFAEFNMEGLLRGDSASRSTFYSTMVNNGLWTRDEVRRKENMTPKGGNADVLTVQSAMVAIDDMNKGTNSADNAARNAVLSWLGITPESSKE